MNAPRPSRYDSRRGPSPAEVLEGAIESKFDDVHTSLPAKVTKYDAATGTVEAQPVIRFVVKDVDGFATDAVDHPVIPNIPVAWQRGGGFYVRFPLAVGDHVLLIFSEAATALWRSTGQIAEPGDLRRHDMSYAYALPGVAPDSNQLPAADGMIVIGSAGGRFELKANGDCHMSGSLTVDGAVTVNGEVTAMAAGPGVKLSTHLHGTAMGPSSAPTPGT